MYQSPLKSGHLHNLALRHRIDVVGVAIVPFSTMGSPNLVLEYYKFCTVRAAHGQVKVGLLLGPLGRNLRWLQKM